MNESTANPSHRVEETYADFLLRRMQTKLHRERAVWYVICTAVYAMLFYSSVTRQWFTPFQVVFMLAVAYNGVFALINLWKGR